MLDIETKRQEIQDRLDKGKSQRQRNMMGQFATPYPLAVDIMRLMRGMAGKDDVSFLEPSIGTGAFYSAFCKVFGEKGQRTLGFEVDEHYFSPSKELWSNHPIEIRHADFLSQTPDELFDMIVANPPYVRHHHIEKSRKLQLKARIKNESGLNVTGLSGLYCYFMILSTAWLADGGLSCWLVPSEFMDVNYGETVKKYLLTEVELLMIHRFSPDASLFSDALVSSCLVVFRNSRPAGKATVRLSMGRNVNAPESVIDIRTSDINASEKWTPLFKRQNRKTEGNATLGDFFCIKRGIATGDNKFFIIDKRTIERFEIPKQFLIPILPSPRYITDNEIYAQEDGLPLLDRQLFLFNCTMPENELKETHPKTWEYINIGRQTGVAQGYICSRRKPWYTCEKRAPAPIVVPYMGRYESAKQPFRFILNDSEAITTNVYLLMYPKPQYARCLSDKTVMRALWKALNAIPASELADCGRFYGGGLRKIEPRELMAVPAHEIAAILKLPPKIKELQLF